MHITIDRRFCGPPTTANGGYVSGALAREVSDADAIEVTLRVPPPLDTPLAVRANDGVVALLEDEVIVAEAKPSVVDLAPPDPVTFEDAHEASRRYPGLRHHPYPRCFVCGPARAPGDGLRIFPGAVEARSIVAAPWVPDSTVVANDDRARVEIVWASLDCPSFFGMYAFEPDAPELWLLGRLTASVRERPHRGERCVALGWLVAREGRKAHTGSALYGADGRLYGIARSTWIALKKP